jgi:hypothetical protein
MHVLLQNELKHANTVLDWCPSDTEEEFDRNVKDNSEQLEELKWTKHNVTYSLDSFAFRNSEAVDFKKEYNIVLGCSHSFGIGVNENDIWFNHLKPHFDEPFYNASVPGGSIGGCYRSLHGFLDLGLKIKRVFMFTPDRSRHEYFNDKDNKWKVMAWWTGEKPSITKVCLNENYLTNFYQTNLMSIKYICDKNNIELTDMASDAGNDIDVAINESRKARDLMHPGVDTHKFIGKKFYEEYCRRYHSST